ncbi:MAG TPA: DEAD/DEAH box helicase, partial [Chloroflexota bacterium]|nr:DEAD/DEAH box helicase [Chloroflexota bacterium]
MNPDQIVDRLLDDPAFASCVTAYRLMEARPAQYADFPASVDRRLVEALRSRGISRLYSHQARAIEEATAGHNVAIVTPTASGKTLCYNVPVVGSIIEDPNARALYLFPTKAL